MAEDHETPEAGQLSRAWTRGHRETEIAKARATQRVRSWTMQNQLRGVIGRVSASAARRIFDFFNSREVGA